MTRRGVRRAAGRHAKVEAATETPAADTNARGGGPAQDGILTLAIIYGMCASLPIIVMMCAY